jgi:hypothetical protein
MVTALLEQVPGQQRDGLPARAPALETAPQVDVDPGMPVHRVVLLVIGDAPGDLPGGLHYQQR